VAVTVTVLVPVGVPELLPPPLPPLELELPPPQATRRHLKVTMNRLDVSSGKAVWTQPDSLEITAPAPASARAGNAH